ncbi:MAG: DNA-binding protein [Candidatus Bathyarchaeia archaeon]|nr:DNA-binding protein [Candidatus Bathyarchaeota archaeon]
MSKEHRVLVLDTSAFIAGFDPMTVEEEVYTVPEVGLELTDESTPKMRFIASVESERLIVRSPAPNYVDLIKSISNKIGDSVTLSETDIQVLALAAQLRDNGHDVIILTDDYSIQNTAEKMGIKYAPLSNLGIRYQFQWIIRCPACGRKYPPDKKEMICNGCGSGLERRPVRKIPVKGKHRAAVQP